MPQFVAMEGEHGSLIAALQARTRQRMKEAQPIFTSLRRGMQSLIEALVAKLPNERIHLERKITRFSGEPFDQTVVATSLGGTRSLLTGVNPAATELLPINASSAILVAFAWPENLARTFTIPSGFGFLVPQGSVNEQQLLACTFVDQKFPHRAPHGAKVMRAFFGSESAESMNSQSDNEVASVALKQLQEILGAIPKPSFHTVRRWPRSLPQYEVGHLDRIAELDRRIAEIPGLHLLGNSYCGVGIPDLIRDARALARRLCS
jgi:oxygen-dependent protoporphyrinogen oxidase